MLSQNSLEFQEVYSACEISGYICATVNWRLAIPEMVFIINDGAPKVFIFEADYAETRHGHAGPVEKRSSIMSASAGQECRASTSRWTMTNSSRRATPPVFRSGRNRMTLRS